MRDDVREAISFYERAKNYDRDIAKELWTIARTNEAINFNIPNVEKTVREWVYSEEETVRRELIDPQLWAVGENIAPIITRLAEEMPRPDNDIISPECVPALSGFVHIPSGLLDKGASDPTPYPFHAISWDFIEFDIAEVKRNYQDVELDEAKPYFSLVIHPWLPYLKNKEHTITDKPVPHVLSIMVCGSEFWIAHETTDDPERNKRRKDWSADHLWLPRWLLTLFAWANSESETETQRLDRATTRRLQRSGGTQVDIRTIKLRKSAQDAERESLGLAPTGTVQAHFRRSHWRWQPCGPGRQERKLIRVREHIVGKGTPKQTKKVNMVDRI